MYIVYLEQSEGGGAEVIHGEGLLVGRLDEDAVAEAIAEEATHVGSC